MSVCDYEEIKKKVIVIILEEMRGYRGFENYAENISSKVAILMTTHSLSRVSLHRVINSIRTTFYRDNNVSKSVFFKKIYGRLEKLNKYLVTEEININRIKNPRRIPKEIKLIVFRRDRGCCVICGKKKGLNYQFDHDYPFSKGGSSLDPSNVRLTCISCNLRKSNRIE